MTDAQHPKANAEVMLPSRPFVSEIPKLRKIIASEGLTGLANDTKWNELITAMRQTPTEDWCSSFRYRCIDSDFVSHWDCEWWHHLPFPFISVMWFDLSCHEEIHLGRLLEPTVVDHSPEIVKLLSSIGFDFEIGSDAIRIFGYAPRARDAFIPKRPAEQAVDPNA
jgi:hypothetical protein